jgi:hypothetical protein
VPIHDWTRVDASIFHAFHHSWVMELAQALNDGELPDTYYALIEQPGAEVRAEAVSFQGTADRAFVPQQPSAARRSLLMLGPPWVPLTAETDMQFYRCQQNTVTVREADGDALVAVVEVVLPGTKVVRRGLQRLVERAAELLDKRIHLLILDLHPPGKRDPHGIHAAIWEEISGQESEVPPDRPLTLASYESGLTVRAFVVTAVVGDELSDMPLFLDPGACVNVPLEATYRAAFAALPRRWQVVLERPASPAS